MSASNVLAPAYLAYGRLACNYLLTGLEIDPGIHNGFARWDLPVYCAYSVVTAWADYLGILGYWVHFLLSFAAISAVKV